MRCSRKLLAMLLTGLFAVGLIPLGACERQDTDKATIEIKKSDTNDKEKVTVETKTRDLD